MTRYTLRELRTLILANYLDDDWTTAAQITRWLGLGGSDHYRVSLVLERLVVEGVAEIRNPRSRGKRFFRRPEASA